MTQETQDKIEKYIPVESKENYFAIDLAEGQNFKVLVDETKAVEVVIPYDGKMRCYMVGEKRPALHYKTGA